MEGKGRIEKEGRDEKISRSKFLALTLIQGHGSNIINSDRNTRHTSTSKRKDVQIAMQ